MNGRLFIGTIYVQNRKIVWDSVRKLAYDMIFLREILARFKSLS